MMSETDTAHRVTATQGVAEHELNSTHLLYIPKETDSDLVNVFIKHRIFFLKNIMIHLGYNFLGKFWTQISQNSNSRTPGLWKTKWLQRGDKSHKKK